MPDNTSDWNALLADYVDKEIILILAGAPVEPFAAMKGVVKAAEGNLWRLLCKAGVGPNGETAPGGTLTFAASDVRRVMDNNADPTPSLVI